MFPAGVYQIRAWCKGYKAVSQSVTIGETDQTITLKLPKETANTYTVQFLVADCYDSEYTPEGATVSLEGYGPTWQQDTRAMFPLRTSWQVMFLTPFLPRDIQH